MKKSLSLLLTLALLCALLTGCAGNSYCPPAQEEPEETEQTQSISIAAGKLDGLSALYLRVLEDLWGKDGGLNDGVEYVSVDLSATSLASDERSAVASAFAQSHGAEPLELNYEQLCEQGYISGLEDEDFFPAWENGLLFTITETDEPVMFDLPDIAEGEEKPDMARYNVKNTVSFDASKWRTALGAYGFSGCTAVRNSDGEWGYTVAAKWIS